MGLLVNAEGMVVADDTELSDSCDGRSFGCRLYNPDPKTLKTAGLKNLIGLRSEINEGWFAFTYQQTIISTIYELGDPNFKFVSPNGLDVATVYESYPKDMSRPNITYDIGKDAQGNIKDIYLNEDGTGNIQGKHRGFFPVQNPNYTGKITWHAIYKQYLRYLKCMRIKYLKEANIDGLSYGAVESDLRVGQTTDSKSISYESITSDIMHVGLSAIYRSDHYSNDGGWIKAMKAAEKQAVFAAFNHFTSLMIEFNSLQSDLFNSHNDALTKIQVDAVTGLYDVADEYIDKSRHNFGIVVPKEKRASNSSNGNGWTQWQLPVDSSNVDSRAIVEWSGVYRLMNTIMVVSEYANQRCKSCYQYDELKNRGRLFPRLYLNMGQNASSGYFALHAQGDEMSLENVDLMKSMADRDAELAGGPAWFDADNEVGPDGTLIGGDDVGSNYTFWSGKFETITYPAKEVVDGINLQYFHDYFDCMKYGLRLLYVPPSRPYGKWSYNEHISNAEKIIEENKVIIKKLDAAFEITKESFKSNEYQGSGDMVTFDRATFNDLQNVYAADKAFDIVEYDPNMAGGASDPLLLHNYNDNQWRLHPIPLIDVRTDIEQIYCTAGPLEFSAFRPSEAGARHTLLAGYDIAYTKLTERMKNTPEYRLLFNHIFPYERFASMISLHGGLTNQDVRMENRFKATRTTILDFIMAMIDQQELPYSMQKYGSLSNFQAGTDANSTSAPQTDWEDIAMRMMYIAPRMILKGVVQLTDPCVGTAIAINDLVMTIVQTSIMIAEQVRDGIVNSLNMIISDLKTQLDVIDAAANDQETGTLDLTIKILEATIDGYENPAPPGEPAPDYIIQERRNQLDELITERNALLDTKASVESSLEEAMAAVEAAQDEMTEAIEEVKKVVEAISPYMVPGLSFAQMPTMIPYGFLFAPPPFGPGVGPPMTSFGFIYCLLLIIEGLIDDFDKAKEEVVRELIDEEPACKNE